MKSFAKTFRTFLAMSLVLCMVMSCVAVSADELSKVTLNVTQVDTAPDADGYYTVTATVGEGDASAEVNVILTPPIASIRDWNALKVVLT